MWNPGGSGDGVNPVGLGILGVCGLWAYWEYKRPGGKLAPKQRGPLRVVRRWGRSKRSAHERAGSDKS